MSTTKAENGKLAAAAATTAATDVASSKSDASASSDDSLPILPDLTCAMCSEDDKGTFVAHPVLGLAVCQPCYERIKDVNWTVDEDGTHEWCSLCADGGDMFLCDDCGRAICVEDCKEVAGQAYVKQCKASDNWKCWKCDPSPIAVLLAKTREYLSIPVDVRKRVARITKERVLDQRRRLRREQQMKEYETQMLHQKFGYRGKGRSRKQPKQQDTESEVEEENKASTTPRRRGRPSKSREVIALTSDEEADEAVKEEQADEDGDDSKKQKQQRNRMKRKSKPPKEEDEEEEDDEPVQKKQKKDSSSKVKPEEKLKKEGNRRREIAKLLDDAQLLSTTRDAEDAEKQRIERLEKRNQEAKLTSTSAAASFSSSSSSSAVAMVDGFDDSASIKLLTPTAVMLNPNHPPNEPALYVPSEVARYMKPHQIAGARFMWDIMIESIAFARELPMERGLGCLLAHYCGLGKSLTTIAFVYVTLNAKLSNHVMIVAPVNTLQNWIAEFDKWLSKKNKLDIWNLESCQAHRGKSLQKARLQCLEDWHEEGGVMIIGYEGFRSIWKAKGQKLSQKENERMKHLLLNTPDILIADEGHRIKLPHTSVAQALRCVRTRRRVVLTGTPLQNNVGEYYTMMNFVRPYLLGSASEFNNRFQAPIRNGQCLDSTESDVKLMKSRIHVLTKKLEPIVHRVEYEMLDRGGRYQTLKLEQTDNSDSVVAAPHDPSNFISVVNSLPTKHEFVIFVRLSALQRQLYERFITTHRLSLFRAYHALMKIWNHPSCLHASTSAVEVDSDDDIDRARSRARNNNNDMLPNPDVQPGQPWYGNLLSTETGYVPGRIEDSGKMVICISLLAECLHQHERVLLFSQSLDMLDLLENMLMTYFGLVKNSSYFRLDGSTSAPDRHKSITEFNDEQSNARVFLISTRAGCLGVNLVGASRVIVYDASWNPTNDEQATFRAYRFGQTRSVMIYRLVSHGGMEERIYRRQLMKNGLSLRVVDRHEVDRLFSRESVEELWRLDECTEQAEEEEAKRALDALKHKTKVETTMNGEIVIEVDSDSDLEKEHKSNTNPNAPAASAAAATTNGSALSSAVTASSNALVLDPHHPITDSVLCSVLSHIGPKRLRSHFSQLHQQHLNKQLIAREKQKEQEKERSIQQAATLQQRSPAGVSLQSSNLILSPLLSPRTAAARRISAPPEIILIDDDKPTATHVKGEEKQSEHSVPAVAASKKESDAQKPNGGDTPSSSSRLKSLRDRGSSASKLMNESDNDIPMEEEKKETPSQANRFPKLKKKPAKRPESTSSSEYSDDNKFPSASSSSSYESEATSSESDGSASVDSDEDDDDDYGGRTKRRKAVVKKGGVRTHRSNTKSGSHPLAEIALPLEEGSVGALMKAYVAELIHTDASTSSAERVSIPTIISSRSWVACIQQPDALLAVKTELELTDEQRKEAEAEFEQAMVAEATTNFSLSATANPEAAAAAMLPLLAQASRQNIVVHKSGAQIPLIMPPPGAQFVPNAVYESIRAFYLFQIQKDHRDFFAQVVLDLKAGRAGSQKHLQKHWSEYFTIACRQQGIDLDLLLRREFEQRMQKHVAEARQRVFEQEMQQQLLDLLHQQQQQQQQQSQQIQTNDQSSTSADMVDDLPPLLPL